MGMNPRLLRPILSGDPDALRYIAAVQAADQQSLEPAVRKAITDFVVGCKRDGIWTAIKASCILMGARTLAGALTPLVGAGPTNVNNGFVSGDYDRKTGLAGNGTTKYLNANRLNNADPQDSFHMAIYSSTAAGNNAHYIGSQSATSGTSRLLPSGGIHLALNRTQGGKSSGSTVAGFFGTTRSSSSAMASRSGGTDYSFVENSGTPQADPIYVFANYLASTGNPSGYSSCRLQWYSIGEHLTLSLLDARLATLVSAIGAAL